MEIKGHKEKNQKMNKKQSNLDILLDLLDWDWNEMIDEHLRIPKFLAILLNIFKLKGISKSKIATLLFIRGIDSLNLDKKELLAIMNEEDDKNLRKMIEEVNQNIEKFSNI